jgi:RHS repeat-associated protein
MDMPGRQFNATTGYRYGFNGKENDKDAGVGIQDYGLRIYDRRLVRFLSVDPLTKDFPFYTPYQFSGNNPIKFIDLDGAEQFDPSSKPTGIAILHKATAPGVASQTKSIFYKNYEFRGIWGVNGEGYWIARYHHSEGKYKGMYNDEYVVGTDALFKFMYSTEKYHNRYEWSVYGESLGGPELSVKGLGQNWVNTVKNPINWIGGASIWAAGAKGLGRNILRTEANAAEKIVARGISGRSFTEAEISSALKSGSSEEMMTLYRGVSGKEGATVGGSNTLYLTEDAAYAAAYARQNGLTVQTYKVSRSGFNQLKNEGLITQGTNNGVLVDRAGKTVATGGEISTSTEAIKKVITNSKSN